MSPSRLQGIALALFVVASQAGAVGLGEIEVRSALGERFDARLPLVPAPGEAFNAACFTLAPRAGDEVLPGLGAATLTIERASAAPALRIRSNARVFEPALGVRIRAACPGQAELVERRYEVLLDPRPQSEGITAIPAIGATLDARAGDSLQSIATRVFPRRRAARLQYLAALRDVNPQFAALGATAPLPEGSPVALPDLRTFSRSSSTVAPSSPPAPAREVASAPRADPKPAAKSAPQPTPARAASEAPKTQQAPAFVLKLSSAEADLSRSRGIDDRLRAQLRERLLVLDADDQVAALLSLRNNMRQLESRVAELQLKLATAPVSLPPRSVAAQPSATSPPMIESPKIDAPRVEAPKAEPPKPVAPRVEAPKAEPPKPVAPRVESPTRAPASQPTPAPQATPRADRGYEQWLEVLPPWAWAAVGGFTALAALALALRRRRPEPNHRNERAVAGARSKPRAPAVTVEGEPTDEGQRDDASLSSDAGLSTRLPENSRELRRRYIEERFPEIANRTLALQDTASIIKGARLFHEDGNIPRAVELLQFTIDDNPGEVRTWLALFEIFRLERLTGEFAGLARRFRDQHGKSEYWRKVQYFGHEIDPGNELYREDAVNTLETIGPNELRRLAAAASFDPLAENWLDAPMDFENEVLAIELRQALMAQAGITEQDLAANPMPALRNIEMFTVA